MVASSEDVNPAGFGESARRASIHGAGTRTVDVDATDADGAEAARLGEPVEQPCIDEGRVQAVEHLDEAVDHLPKRLDRLGEVRCPEPATQIAGIVRHGLDAKAALALV